MKKLILSILFWGTTCICNAQVLAEWFNQKATQKKYLLQQIAALQIYMGYLEKGYSIAKSGLDAIGNVKNGHFNLDKDFFASLENINPKVKNYSRVADIVMLNIKIVKEYKQTLVTVKKSKNFNENEISYLEKVFTSLVEGCIVISDELVEIISSGKFNMSDDERISRINGLHQEMQERYLFMHSFSNDAAVLVLQRKQEAKDVKVLGELTR